jgi:hypothetical protein
VSLTILPGEHAQTDAPPESAPAHRGTRRGWPPVSRRTAVVGLAAVVAVAGAGGFFFLHKSGSASPALSPAPVAHTRLAPETHAKSRMSNTQAVQEAGQIFTVIPEQLPGWQVTGAAKVEPNAGGADPVSRSIERCLCGAGQQGVSVDSPSTSQRTATPTVLSVDATLVFVRNATRARSDIAKIRSSATQRCIGSAVANHTSSFGPGSSFRFTSTRHLAMPAHVFGMQFDGRVDSNVIGAQSVRVVMMGTFRHATEVMLVSTGFGTALSHRADLHLLNALAARTAQVIP